MRRTVLTFLVLLTPMGAACLVKDTTHRLYLSPDGAVEWTALERDVRSSENVPAERMREEQVYLNEVHAGTHSILEGLRRLQPDRASVRLLRAERPYAAMFEARFQRADVMIGKLFEELRIPGSATIRQHGGEATLTIAIDLSAVGDQDEEPDSPVAALVEDVDRYRIVLTSGRFTSAEGFALVDEGTAADLRPELVPVDRPAALRLTWKVR